uniref:Uncharacterized protein n=1 Tax=Photinus pyralis TaxID=7054 RepID=A0A1Y1KRB6_PHOPY
MSNSCGNRSDKKVQLERELFQSSHIIYTKHLKSALMDIWSIENYVIINQILQNIVIPDECFNWCIKSTNVCCNKLTFLFDKKEELDCTVRHFVNRFSILSEMCVSNNLALLPEVPLHIRMYILDLVKDAQFNVDSIVKNYKNFLCIMDDAMCTAIEYANVKALEMLYDICIKRNVQYRFRPYEDARHKKVYNWILENIRRGSEVPNASLGWTCGPDSAFWPSTQLSDYKRTFTLLKKIMKDEPKGNVVVKNFVW